MTPLPFFVRNCVKSLHYFLIRFVFAFFEIFTVFFFTIGTNIIINIMLHSNRICCTCRFLIYFQDFSSFWIVFHLLFKRIVWPCEIMSRQCPTFFWFRKKILLLHVYQYHCPPQGRAHLVSRLKMCFCYSATSTFYFQKFLIVICGYNFFGSLYIACITFFFHTVHFHCIYILRKIIFHYFLVFK